MVVEEPVAGSFSHFAYKYWGDFAGFLSGWNILGDVHSWSGARLTAVGTTFSTGGRDPHLGLRRAVFVLINLITWSKWRLYGETEFWFAIIKVVAIVGMIVFGAWLLASGNGGPEASITNLWQGGFMPHGFSGLVMAMAVIMFSFGGLELVGITAAEAADPHRSIPKSHQSGGVPAF